MYAPLLALHSLFRWVVLIALIYSIIRASNGYFRKKVFSKTDNSLRHWTATIVHIQLLLGIGLYSVSPIVNYFLHQYREAVHQREIRFFGMEHSTMMIIAVVIITIGSAKAKRKPTDREKFKTMAIWYSIGLFIILTSIPWPFSPFTGRPYLRPF